MSDADRLSFLFDRVPADARVVVALDAPAALAAAWRQLNPDGAWVDWAEAARLPDGAADAVVVAAELPEPAALDRLVRAARRLLAPGGAFVFLARHAGHVPAAGEAPAASPSAPGPAAGGGAPGAYDPVRLAAGLARRGLHAAPFAVVEDRPAAPGEPDHAAARTARVAVLGGVAEAGTPPERMTVLACLRNPDVGQNAAMAEVRVVRPSRLLCAIPGVTLDIQRGNGGITLPRGAENAIFLYQRPILTRPNDLRLLAAAMSRGYVTVIEFDDHPNRWPAIAAHDYLTYRGAHAVQTSTPALAELFGTFNPNVALFANAVAELPAWRERPARPDPVRIFYGALNRADSIAPYIAACNAVLAATDRRVEVVVLSDRAFFDALATPAKRYAEAVPHEALRRALAAADIVLLPLADTEFNRCKSDLGFIEAAARGAVALASPVVYADTLRDGETGVLFRTPEEFADRFRRLIEDDPWRRAIAERAYAYVRRERLMRDGFRARHAWYRELIRRKAELDRAVLERVPDLRALVG